MRSDRGPRGSRGGKPVGDDRLRAALQRAEAEPLEDSAWDALEALAAELQQPDEVAALYRRLLADKRAPALVGRLGERALRFHEEWLGDDPEALVSLLSQVLAADPGLDWPFARLTLVYSVSQRWSELLALYDRTLKALPDGPRHRALLLEAAGVAKDFVGDIDRAVGYLGQLFALRPADAQVAASLERLLERQGAWQRLAEVWQARLPLLSGSEARELRERAAALFLDKLGAPERALTEARLLLETGSEDAAVALLERILANPETAGKTRSQALEWLRAQYEKTGREEALVEALRVALGFAAGPEKLALLRETAERQHRRGDTGAALAGLVELVGLSPEDAALRARLQHLAASAGAPEAYVRGLLAAAEAASDRRLRSTLLLEAAQVEEDHLARPGEAIALYRRVAEDQETEPRRRLLVLRRLADLLQPTSAERFAVLEQQAELEPGAGARRVALGEVARLAQERGEPDRAIAAWQKRLALDGADREALDALVDLAGASDEPEGLIEALRRRAGAPLGPIQQRADLTRIAEIQAARGDLAGAVDTWRVVEERFGGDTTSTDALRELLARAERWADLFDRVARQVTLDGGRLAELACFLGETCRERLDDPPAAVSFYARSLTVDPRSAVARRGLENLVGDERSREPALAALVRAYQETGDWRGLLEVLEHRLAQEPAPRERARLRAEAAVLAERRAEDSAAALTHLAAALALAPEDGHLADELLRVAEVSGQWTVAVEALAVAARGLPEAAAPRAAWLRGLEGRLRQERLGDEEGARRALEAAAALGSDVEPLLEQLAALQRRRPDRSLVRTLARLAALRPANVEPLAEALSVAETLEDDALAGEILGPLFDRSVQVLRARSDGAAEAALGHAVDKLTKTTPSNAKEARRAADLLLHAARLLPAPKARGLRDRAARIALAANERALARDILRRTVEEDPSDRRSAETLAGIYEQEQDWPALLALRRRALAASATSEERLAQRLELARLGALVEAQTARVETLMANLEEAPGHEASVAALSELLVGRGRQRELADVLAGQARRLDEHGDSERAVRLWAEVAELAEKTLADVPRAILACERVAALGPTPAVFDALARLYERCGEPGTAAGWLEQRLAATADRGARGEVSARLAQAYLTAGQRHRAVAALERAVQENPAADALRLDLIGLYRAAEAWPALARSLAERCAHSSDPEVVLGSAREAVALFRDRLGAPREAATVLERALALHPQDRELRTALAEAWHQGGELAKARGVLEGLLEEAGRRRTRERASLHYQIALVARAENNLPLALEHLEQAAAISLDHKDAQLALAEVAEEVGDLPRAEQALRALLVLARRGATGQTPLSVCEVLLRLERLARARGEAETGAECFDSAVAAAMQDPAEARRMQAALIGRGDAAAALALLDKRRAAAANPADEARIACERAEALASLGQEAEALDLLLAALDKVPEREEAHAQARSLARKLGRPQAYEAALLGALEQRRRWDDGPRVADLLLRAAAVAEEDLKEPKRAVPHYQRAEQTGTRLPEALVGLARASAAAGDKAEEERALEALRRLAEEAPTPAEGAAIFYRLAERQLASQDHRAAGLEALARALEAKPDFPRALALVESAAIPETELPRVMPLYEKIARASGRDRMLLDYLSRWAETHEASQAEVREGMELALSLGETARAEKLLERAVALGRERPEGLREAVWALIELAQHRRAAGDLPEAARLLEDALGASVSPRILAALRELAREASRQGDTALAARILERLREAHPTDREVWQPLLELYRAVGDRSSMERVVNETAPGLLDRSERNALRMTWAAFLAEAQDLEAARSVLQDVLLEEPGRPEAVLILADLHERRGEVNEAVALLSEALRETDGRSVDPRRGDLARRLADLVGKADPSQAKQVYRSALAASLADGDLKRALQASLLALLSEDDEIEERAALTEALLAGETGNDAAARALDLFDLRQRLGDQRGAVRALEIGRARAPHSRALIERLEAHHRGAGHFRELAALLAEAASHEPDGKEAATLFRRAARLERDDLGDAAAAAALLRRAVERAPGDAELLRELAACLVAAGQREPALAEVSAELDKSQLTAEARAGLLCLRAELRQGGGEEEAAVADLEEAFSLAGPAVASELSEALVRFSRRCAERGDTAAERSATFRLAKVLGLQGDGSQAHQVLLGWIERHPEDHEALRVLRRRFEADERWEEVARICLRLLDLEEGEARIDVALGLAEACERLGRPADALPILESLLEQAAGHRVLLGCLVRLHRAAQSLARAGMLMVEIADREEDEEARFRGLTEAAAALLEAGDPQTAFAAAERAVGLRPRERATRRLLAEASLAAGLYQEAADVLSSLIGDSRGSEPAEVSGLYQRLGRAAAGQGDRAAQLQALKRALEADRKNGDVASELADLAEAIGDHDLALRALRAVTLHAQNGPLTPALAFFRQARIVLRLGDRSRAIIFAKRALQEDPELGEARTFLQELS